MLIPSIDLMGGKIVQLVQGEKKAFETTDFDAWCERFAGFPMVQLIDLDAAKRQGDNRELIANIVLRLPCQVGGGVRDADVAERLLAIGAKRVIVGSSYIRDGRVDVDFARGLAERCGTDRVIAAIDSREGFVAVRGWQESVPITAGEMIAALTPYVGGFLYTHVDTEGLLVGFPTDIARRLRTLTEKQLIAAGGIRSQEEIDELDGIGVDAVVGMAIYTGKLVVKGNS
ncbi:1-(5-phosphoribosyl)-5-[(5-phosphoribosylamino)methylideneamino] imidazole-4-carboxamide isomerase [Candidatus Koribacter versatilis Ellin345]|uniref:1-(5-phosphoribosyl)-5-[(5-phosphoribosylamino)methylideneamino]imidazole-4-carboxamideisomerase n=1 Tax=Koribacter versatilis (strain Ellin345) TaxID=204669 RepID=Q1IKB1_KORVE|nr:1-(5-phosphoribosyl)-5-[(5-phosphoribosylamino)methylideneamino] imidazole-4-carboxamide isomerase [Candidatus Koribacter versatilis]ABF42689.1 1-(5-phosphoribosyl)-5-[(5-phosphoribosylamino)methylideneamino] imidazole-4-carboxamide isomerase [Candidatus Koribacter versatilis Ellin345]